jgi:hypothetical protein
MSGGVFQLLAEKVVYAPRACGGELAYASGGWEGIRGKGEPHRALPVLGELIL